MYIIASEENAGYCLVHHGIKGQKWGIRRYQNEDGSLTPAGEKRYGDGERGMVRKYNDAFKTVKKEARLNKEKLSSAELGKRSFELAGIKSDKDKKIVSARMQRDVARNCLIYRGVVDAAIGTAQGVGGFLVSQGKMDKSDFQTANTSLKVAAALNTGLGALDIVGLVKSQKELNKARAMN